MVASSYIAGINWLNSCLEFLSLWSWGILVCSFTVTLFFLYQGNTGLVELIGRYYLLLNFLEEFVGKHIISTLHVWENPLLESFGSGVPFVGKFLNSISKLALGMFVLPIPSWVVFGVCFKEVARFIWAV